MSLCNFELDSANHSRIATPVPRGAGTPSSRRLPALDWLSARPSWLRGC